MICTNCGNVIPDEARFCPICGASIAPAAQPSSDAASPEQGEQGGWYQSQEQQTYGNEQQVYVPAKPQIGSIFDFYRQAFAVLRQKPVKLWGLSLLYVVVACLISSLGAMLPLVSIPIVLLLSLGFTGILLRGFHGEEVHSEQLFSPFRKEEILRNGGGMCWMGLWTMIWGFVPVMNIIKAYAYSLTPYILATDKEIGATDALKKSMRMTDGFKGKMFGADILLVVGVWVVFLLLVLLARIPYIGILFGIVLVLFYIACLLFLPLFMGLVRTAIFEAIRAAKGE